MMKTVNHTEQKKAKRGRRSIRLKGYDYSREGAYFVTICVQDKRCLLSSVKDCGVVLSSIGEFVYQYLIQIPVHYNSAELDGFVIMPSHVHALIIIHDNVGAIHELPLHELPLRRQRRNMLLPHIIGRFKMNSAKMANLKLQKSGQRFWQRNYYEHIVRNEDSLNRIREYIINNPMRWQYDRENPNRIHDNTGNNKMNQIEEIIMANHMGVSHVGAIHELPLHSAFERVKENGGCAGVDGVTVEKFDERIKRNIDALRNELLTSSYQPLPLMRILVDKGNGEARALSVPAVRDRVVQTAVLDIIRPLFEAEFEQCSYAYRKGRSVKQVVYKISEYYEEGYVWVVDADIDAFFDSVDHDILIRKIKRLIKDKDIVRLITMWIKAEVWDGKSVNVLEKGIPQGSAISPILANLFLDKFDEELLRNGHKLVRFSDDFIILTREREEAVKALRLTDRILERLSLELDEADIVNFDDGFKFLGVTFLKSMTMVPFDRPKREKKVLHYPRPLNLPIYFLKKNKGW